MDTEFNLLLQPIDIADLLLRFASVGQLVFLLLFFALTKPHKPQFINIFLILCVIAYILLTTTIPDPFYGNLRPPLLLFTDLTCYALLLFYTKQVGKLISIQDIPRPIVVILGLWFLWLGYFFIINRGQGNFHDVHHLIGLVILIYIVIDAARGYVDDLNQKSRNLRLLLTISLTVYMASLTTFELVLTELKDTWWFSLANALTICIITTSICLFKFKVQLLSPQQQVVLAPNKPQLTVNPSTEKLLQLMEGGYYRTNGLTIKKLATELALPEHQLRELINTSLGFTNFSHFLNSYRLSAACQQLQDPGCNKLPILTIALNLGFDSISPFNRSFKLRTGLTPSEYRRQFQNR